MHTTDTPREARSRRTHDARGVRVLIALTLMSVSVCLTFLAFETVLAHLGKGDRGVEAWRAGEGYHAPDGELIYFPKPGATKIFKTPEFTEHVRINSLGLRDDEIQDRSQFDFRIVIIGDSMTFGHGVQMQEAFPNVLEALYRERDEDRRVDVVNAGVKGYGTDQYYALFQKRLRRLRPDLLIVAFYQNDLADNILHPLFKLEGGQLIPVDPTEDELYRIGRVNELLPGFLRSTRVARWTIHRLVDSTTRRPGNGELNERLRVEPLKIRLEIDDLAETGRREGFDVLVLGVPHRNGPPMLYSLLEDATRDRARLLDLNSDDSWQRQKARWFFATDFHLNAAGHERVAAELFAYLEREGL